MVHRRYRDSTGGARCNHCCSLCQFDCCANLIPTNLAHIELVVVEIKLPNLPKMAVVGVYNTLNKFGPEGPQFLRQSLTPVLNSVFNLFM